MSINEQPLVTVYIPTFNRLELLQRAVESVRNQTYKNLEIIVVDDCSTDGTQEYLVKLSKEDERVRYFLKEKNSGACVSRNIAIENAKGKFITGLDDDDVFLNNRIMLFIEASKKLEMEKSILFSNIALMKYESNFKKKCKNYLNKKRYFKYDLIFNNYIGNQVFVQTKHLKNIGGFDPNMKMWQDLECWYRLMDDKVAIRLNNSTYLLDVDHNYARISESKLNKLEETFEYFSNKHNLDLVQKNYLRTQFIHYDIDSVDLFKFLKKIFISKNFWDFTLFFKLIVFKFKKDKFL